MNRAVVGLVALSVAALGAGCTGLPATGGLGGGDYSSSQARTSQSVELATIEAIRSVTIQTKKSPYSGAAATGIGAIAGGALGSQVGKGKGKKVATVLGVLGGGAAGSAVSKAGSTVKGVELIVATKSRGSLAITQADERIQFRVGDIVRLLRGNDGTWRVVPM